MEQSTQTPPPSASPEFGFAKAYNFRLRMHSSGPFSGQSMWELTRMNDDGTELKIVSDADKLENCLDNLVGELQADGY